MSRNRVTKGRPEFEPTTVQQHRSPNRVNRLHLRAMHLATAKQIGEGQ